MTIRALSFRLDPDDVEWRHSDPCGGAVEDHSAARRRRHVSPPRGRVPDGPQGCAARRGGGQIRARDDGFHLRFAVRRREVGRARARRVRRNEQGHLLRGAGHRGHGPDGEVVHRLRHAQGHAEGPARERHHRLRRRDRWKKTMGFSKAEEHAAYLALLGPDGRVRWLHRGGSPTRRWPPSTRRLQPAPKAASRSAAARRNSAQRSRGRSVPAGPQRGRPASTKPREERPRPDRGEVG